MQRAIGCCFGSSSLGTVVLKGEEVLLARSVSHEGRPDEAFLRFLDEIAFDPAKDSVAVTGRMMKERIRFPRIVESLAVQTAYTEFMQRDPTVQSVRAIASVGGEIFLVYELDAHGQIARAHMGSKCASGTGDFFLQQLRRINVSLEEAVKMAGEGELYRISGRCSVFCKSDCTHALNKGLSKSSVVRGLCRMLADKVTELMAPIEVPEILVIGGVSRNVAVVNFLRRDGYKVHLHPYSDCFEAYGAALHARKVKARVTVPRAEFIAPAELPYTRLQSLSEFEHLVDWKAFHPVPVEKDDVCVLGLDVGSTTTKAVLVRLRDRAPLASIYLRTEGQPVQAGRHCYKAIHDQLKGVPVKIVGLATTGSGRQIAGIYSGTTSIINEITAHATAAAHFDPEVETILEIGGQDAKYTYLHNGTPIDYAMNEACSAGTGSFIEEAAAEHLGITDCRDIAGIAMQSEAPLWFGEQCAAFIGSDIKTALAHEVPHSDIVAGLIYSVAENYLLRVKGSRPVSTGKVFIQGGVCYNRAVPIALAARLGSKVIVPPEPGLMGAYGVALVVADRLEEGLVQPGDFDLEELVAREVEYGEPFTCRGGREKCDLKCNINLILIDGRRYPFGGTCSKYYDLNLKGADTGDEEDLVVLRQKMVFEEFAPRPLADDKRPTVGIAGAFLDNTYYPLFANFFDQLGYRVVRADKVEPEGVRRRGASFCYPVEIAHGLVWDLLKRNPDYVFLPHISSVPVSENEAEYARTCPFVQGYPYYLKATFDIPSEKLLAPILDMHTSIDSCREEMLEMAEKLGVGSSRARTAFTRAVEMQHAFSAKCRAVGMQTLSRLEREGRIAVVLFGRPYNAFSGLANMGVSRKFTSRQMTVIPYDFLPLEDIPNQEDMYWGMGALILKAARFTADHPLLYGTFITNFSCGPDSFILTKFRTIFGRKPTLTLEFDSHTADAGVNTRIEAYLDIARLYAGRDKPLVEPRDDFRLAEVVDGQGDLKIRTSAGELIELTDPRVKLLIPSMGELGTEAMAAVGTSFGINAVPLPVGSPETIRRGKEHATCKECVPYLITTGSLLDYIDNHRDPRDVLVYFMPKASGPCRFGQYHSANIAMLEKLRIPDVAIMSLSDDTSYRGLGTEFSKMAITVMVMADMFSDIRNAMLALARSPEKAMEVFHREWGHMMSLLRSRVTTKRFFKAMEDTARVLREEVPVRQSLNKVPKVLVVGEIYARQDPLSRQGLIETIAKKGIVPRIAPIFEWIQYTDVLNRRFSKTTGNIFKDFVAYTSFSIKEMWQNERERKLRRILCASGFLEHESEHAEEMLEAASPFISPRLQGEAILTFGAGVRCLGDAFSGIVAIGPFACMPSRIAESLSKKAITPETLAKAHAVRPKVTKLMAGNPPLPVYYIETDGNPFPPMVHTGLEIFLMNVVELGRRMGKGIA